MTVFLVVAAAFVPLWTALGFYVGRAAGAPRLGASLGFLLGPLGLLIVALLGLRAVRPEAGRRPEAASERTPLVIPSWIPSAALALTVGAVAAVMLASRRPGHWWGDDWALYIRQAKGLLDFDPGEVARANEFTVTRSDGAAFSPALYPWGFPFLLALAIPFVGDGVDDLAIVGVLAACAFACAWFGLARPRLGWPVALVGVAAVAATPVLVGWGELIQSEWPFMAAATIGLLALDRLARRGWLLDLAAPRWPLVALGVWAAFAFEIRREGLALIPAIAVAQFTWLLTQRQQVDWRARGELARIAARFVVPHVLAAATVLVTKVVLPSVIVPQYSGNSVSNTWDRFDRNVDHVIEIAGFKRPHLPDPTVLGSTTWGWVAAGVWIGFALLGVVLALTVYLRRDAHLVAYVAVAFVIGASAQGSLNRYFATVAPVLTLLGAGALLVVVRLPLRRWVRVSAVVPAAVVALALGTIVVANGRDAWVRMRNTDRILDAGTIEWGAQHPDAQAMYAAVRDLTAPGDVVASPKARAMGLLTERPSIQVDDYRPIPPDVELALLVVEPASPDDDKVAVELHSDPDWTPVWSNSRFVIYQPAAG